jgi:EAL domain-containing protein (putative c-di-GMP-specific phosphodiesterase class I)
MGISLFKGTDTSVEDVMKHAESALRQAKEAGRGVVRYFDPEMDSRVNHRLQVEKELRIAIESDQLRLFYQPIVGLSRNILGYEALIRWQHPTDGILAPGAFIDIAEQTGLIVPMGEWVIRSACKQLVAFQKDPSTRDLTIAVNLSARQLAQPNIAEAIANIVKTSGAPADRLKLEITESMLLTDIEQTIAKMATLSEIGIRFSLDDFGTGYSSLGYLKKLPLSQLKVDQSFVKGLLTDPVDSAIVRTIIQLAKSLGMSVIAEGVESEGQRQALSYMGCKEFQGYLFGKPTPIA